jgi:hypothetical protein
MKFLLLIAIVILPLLTSAQTKKDGNYKKSLSITSPIGLATFKFRLQYEQSLLKNQSIGIHLTNINFFWRTAAIAVEYRKYKTFRPKSKYGYYANLNTGYGVYYWGNSETGIYTALSSGMVHQMYISKKNKYFFEIQLGGRAGVMLNGDLDDNGRSLYLVGPLSLLDLRLNTGFRF